MSSVDYEKMDTILACNELRTRWPGLPLWEKDTALDWLDKEVVPRLRTRGAIATASWIKDCGGVVILSGHYCHRKDWPLAKRLAVLILKGDYTVEGEKSVVAGVDPAKPEPSWSVECGISPLYRDPIMDRNVFRRQLMVGRARTGYSPTEKADISTAEVDAIEVIEFTEAAEEKAKETK